PLPARGPKTAVARNSVSDQDCAVRSLKKSSSMNRATFKRQIPFRKRQFSFALSVLTTITLVVPIEAAPPHKAPEAEPNATVTPTPTPTAAPTPYFKPEYSNSSVSVTVEGSRIDTYAVGGTFDYLQLSWN